MLIFRGIPGVSKLKFAILSKIITVNTRSSGGLKSRSPSDTNLRPRDIHCAGDWVSKGVHAMPHSLEAAARPNLTLAAPRMLLCADEPHWECD